MKKRTTLEISLKPKIRFQYLLNKYSVKVAEFWLPLHL